MAYVLDDLVRHNIWAARELLALCRTLDDETLNATVPGTYGTVIETLRHTINSEASYLFRLTGAWPEYPWDLKTVAGLDLLSERADMLAVVWEQLLTRGTVDTERLGEARGDGDVVFDVRAGIFLTQALHHANEHRAHICTILGARGFEAPELSGWEFALVTGRMAPKGEQSDK
jgi:uncharacterized damage-inducible protein DinB